MELEATIKKQGVYRKAIRVEKIILFNVMKRLFLVVVSAVFALTAFAQTQEELLADLVVVKDGKFTITDYVLAESEEDGDNAQIKMYAEAPAEGVISRDNFLALYTTLTVRLVALLYSGYEIEDLDDLIGNADMEINIYMGKGGYQMELTSSGETERMTERWDK